MAFPELRYIYTLFSSFSHISPKQNFSSLSVMENFGIMGSQFPPGFRFHPTDQELIIHYLGKKVTSTPTLATSIIADIDLYKFDPWELPVKAFFGEGEWFFFSPRDRKYPNGTRPNRAAASGYWKATGIDKPILTTGGSKCLGVKKSLVFYDGRPPKGIKTDWIMHEYRLLHDGTPSSAQKNKCSMRLDDWVLCRVRQGGSIPSETVKQDGKVSTNSPQDEKVSIDSSYGQKSERSEAYQKGPGCLKEWSESQLFTYLTGFQAEGRATSSASDSSESFNARGMVGCDYAVDLAQPLPGVSLVLDSIKRKLSFGALDELMLLPPNKRLQSAHNVYEHSSHASTSSVDDALPEFVIV